MEQPEFSRILNRLDGVIPANGAIPANGSASTNSSISATDVATLQAVEQTVGRTRDYLLESQHADGYWVGELEGDTILESEYVLLLTFLQRENSETAVLAANYIREQQLPDGGWAIYPGGPVEISASVKAYFALKIAGDDPQLAHMQRAKTAILAAGGVEAVNSFTRFYLALLGVIGYHQCPAIPPELILIPKWMPFNIYEMSAWSRTILIPLSIMWASRPVRELPDECDIAELFLHDRESFPVCMEPSETVNELSQKRSFNWHRFFMRVDRAYKMVDRLRIRPFRKIAIRRAERWMLKRFEKSDGLGAIFPPIVWSVVALKCLGYADDSPELQSQLDELDRLCIREKETVRLQPCQSPVWDTAISTLALREAGVSAEHPAILRSVKWLLSKEVRTAGDWAVSNRGHKPSDSERSDCEPSGWFFEFNNEFYPDVDDTCMVVMALRRSLPAMGTDGWDASFLFGGWSADTNDADSAAVIAGRVHSANDFSGEQLSASSVLHNVETVTPQLMAMWRGARWILAMQNADGGWGAFDVDNTRELFTQVPFADHNAMIDPSSADLAGRMLEMFADLKLPMGHPAVKKTLDYVWSEQDAEHCWYGRWGVNYLYGTWQVLVGLVRIGVSPLDSRIRKSADWLKSVQQKNGGWGETPRSYDDPNLKGQGPVTASQTAWAIMGLLAAGEVHSEAVSRGVHFLQETQNADGTWSEESFTGTGFPRVFYLKYHLYCVYFPLMALGRYSRLKSGTEAVV